MHDIAFVCLSTGAVMAGLVSIVFVAIHQSSKNTLSRERYEKMLLDPINMSGGPRFKPQYNPNPQRKHYPLDVVDRMAEYEKELTEKFIRSNRTCSENVYDYKQDQEDLMDQRCEIFRNIRLFEATRPYGPIERRLDGSRRELRKLQRACHLRKLLKRIDRRRASRQRQLNRLHLEEVQRMRSKRATGYCYVFACPPMCNIWIENNSNFHESVDFSRYSCFSCYFDCRMVRNLFGIHSDWQQQCRCGKVMSVHGIKYASETLTPSSFNDKYRYAINKKLSTSSEKNRLAPSFHAGMKNYKCYGCNRPFCNVPKNPPHNSRDLRSGPNHPARAPQAPGPGAAGAVLTSLSASLLAIYRRAP